MSGIMPGFSETPQGDDQVAIVDGNGSGATLTVKPGSTAAVVGDTAAVFALSPNTPLPAGTNLLGSIAQSGGAWAQNLTQVGGTSVVTAGVAGLLAVGGNVASGVTDAGNPIKIGGTFNTTQPTVTTGQRVDFQATNRGAQIVATGVDNFNINLTKVGGTSLVLGQQLMAASFPVVLASDQSGINTFLDKQGTGTITTLAGPVTNQVVVTTNGASTVVFNLTGSWSATIKTQATTDGINWFDILFVTPGINPTIFYQVTSPNVLICDCGGYFQVRVISFVFTSGTVNVAWNLGAGNNFVESVSTTASNFNVTAVPGVPNALSPAAPNFATVGTSSASVIGANSSRKGLVFINTSSNNISFGIDGNPAVLNSGITLTPNGVWEMDERTFTTLAINAIAGGASSNLTIQEFS